MPVWWGVRRLIVMSPSSSASGQVRPAAVVNEQIRSLVRRASGREWKQAERALYGLLREEWLAAVERDEIVEAA